jgi:glycosyltransferase involved in cell wall biosynthesis
MHEVQELPSQHTESGSSDPVVDVGIPTTGQRKYVHEAIASVMAQTFTNWRLLVSVNDVEPGEDFSRYEADERVKVLRNPIAISSYANKNVIVRASTAPYLAILDDDDIWDPRFLERRVQALESNPDCGFVFSTFAEIDAQGAEIGRGTEPFAPEGVQSPETMLDELLAHPDERRLLTAMLTTLVRRSALESVGPAFDESLPVIADYELWLRLASRYPVVFLHTWDASYRRHLQQDSHGARLEREFLDVLDRLDTIIVEEVAHLRPDREALKRQRATWLLSLAVDVGARGERRAAAAMVVETGSLSLRYLLDRRIPAILGTLLLGRAMTPMISTLRSFLERRRLRNSAVRR